jgi:hypothetical protein
MRRKDTTHPAGFTYKHANATGSGQPRPTQIMQAHGGTLGPNFRDEEGPGRATAQPEHPQQAHGSSV